ncbi:beta-ketoacyl-[acyl-carrier-protein] synthase family protein [Roseimaritima ulvae]|uniref:3-oxoacyl-[acyl-carrier-protein] synthase 2 n=1 Tax=Roseimaritima ulvae TaxID=980254 RepID=A0A5B9R8X0_9BACT|nr:beta-ketoacyl-[acyl-carrier-protein] synthase family protein [Roseimaritima ulvae]QEG43341.1 3-oxoacyl-[acyl-carrier-protein] synthase 2 [Roseimaritima ulvae]
MAQHTNPLPRIVITGLGVISPLGNDVQTLFQSLQQGRSGVGPLSRVPTESLPLSNGAEASQFSGAIGDYGPLEKPLQRTIRKGSKVMCREIEMGVAAAQLALTSADLSAERRDPYRTGVIYGCDYIMTLPEEFAAGVEKCLDEQGEFHFERWGPDGKPQVNPLWLLKYLPNMPASHIAIYNDLQGPNNSITLREASAAAALSEAYLTLQRGHSDAILVGATGSRIHPFRTMHACMQEDLASDRDDPTAMSRPFDADRDGGVLGEGAGAMVLETLSHAEARGATILGEIVGYGSSAVTARVTPQFQRQALANVMRAALGEAKTVGHVHAHGLGTVEGDAQEAAAIGDVFAPAGKIPPVVAAKSHFGNLGAGGGMVEAIASLMALQHGTLFPTLNYDTPDPRCDIPVTVDNQTPAGDSFLSVNVTPQGQAAAIRIARFDD